MAVSANHPTFALVVKIKKIMEATVATIGMFDGVHAGHRYVLDCLQHYARQHGLHSMVVTFSTHPRTLLHQPMDGLLTTLEERKALLEATGVDKVLIQDFESIHRMTAEEYMRLLHDSYNVTVLLMGYNHRFGSDRLTDFSDYTSIGKRIGVKVERMDVSPEKEASSSLIRKALLQGYVEVANKMLSREYSLIGKVVRGKGLGHQIGFPTANIQLQDAGKLLPKDGVYIVRSTLSGVTYIGVMNIGHNPTVEDVSQQTYIEVHFPDYAGDLYGTLLRIEILHRLRDEKKFASLDELKRQIASDIRTALSVVQ